MPDVGSDVNHWAWLAVSKKGWICIFFVWIIGDEGLYLKLDLQHKWLR